jgi:predicted DNA-binding transcriptional regulator AlpA
MKSPKTTAPTAAPKKRVRHVYTSQEVIAPDHFYRVYEASKFFGYSNSVLHLKIASGEIPAPIALSDAPKSRARGWYGRVIIRWQQKRESKTAPKLVVGKPVTS